MLSNLRLSRVDHKFLVSLKSFAYDKKQVTTNQYDLFKKIINKYSKQLSKNNFDITDLLELKWSCTLIESSPAYTETYIKLSDSKIITKSPYNKDFVSALRKNPIYSLMWNRELKQHELDFNTNNLRDLIELATRSYPVVNYCDNIQALLNKIKSYEDVKHWNPTLVYKNELLYIGASNSFVMDAIENIELNFNLDTLSNLSTHGITIDKSVIDHVISTTEYSQKQVLFSAQFDPMVEVTDIQSVILWLSELKCDVVFGNWRETSNINKMLAEVNIPCYNSVELRNKTIKDEFKKPVMFSFKSFDTLFLKPQRLHKIIRFVNSQPIDIK
jgi:hypothetical protein